MCGGIEYQNQKIYFPQLDARLPVRLRDGHVAWITWGRRKDEATGKSTKGLGLGFPELRPFMQQPPSPI